MVVVVEIPRRFANSFHRAEENTEPLSEVMFSGRPNLDNHAVMRADAQESEEASVMGTASGQRVERSMMVNR